MTQRYWDDIAEGEQLPPVAYPLTVYRLVMAAGALRDFNGIHHNDRYAKASGAPDMYANTIFLQLMWERCVRDFIGLAGTIRQIKGFRMRSFNLPGDTVTVKGAVERKWRDADQGLVTLKLWSENRQGVSVGPGTVVAGLPLRDSGDSGTERPAR